MVVINHHIKCPTSVKDGERPRRH